MYNYLVFSLLALTCMTLQNAPLTAADGSGAAGGPDDYAPTPGHIELREEARNFAQAQKTIQQLQTLIEKLTANISRLNSEKLDLEDRIADGDPFAVRPGFAVPRAERAPSPDRSITPPLDPARSAASPHADIEDRDQQIRELTAERDRLLSDNKRFDTEIPRLQAALAQALAKQTEYEAQIQKHRDEIAGITEEIRKREEQRAAAGANKLLQQQLDVQKTELRKEFEDHAAELTRLKSERSTQAKAAESLKTELTAKTTKAEALTAEVTQLKEALKKAETAQTAKPAERTYKQILATGAKATAIVSMIALTLGITEHAVIKLLNTLKVSDKDDRLSVFEKMWAKIQASRTRSETRAVAQ